MLGDEQPGQPIGRLERAQRGLGAAGHQVQQPASVAEPHPGRRFELGPEGALGLLERPVALVEPTQGDHRHAQRQVGDASDRLLGPAVPPGQLDRLPAPLHSQRERPPAHQLRPVRQAGDLQEGPADPVRQGDAFLEVPVRLVEARGPHLGDAEVDQRQRPQVLANPEPPRLSATQRMPAAVAPARLRPGGPRADGPDACARRRGPPAHASAGPRVPIPVPGSRAPRYRSASSKDPRASSTPALRAASSASPAITPAGNRVRNSCAVAPSPLSPRPTQWSDRTRAARPQSWAAWACRTASTGYPWSAYQAAATACSTGSSAGALPRSSSCSRSANSWW